MPESQPTRFGKYLLLEKLAVGGMAQLYRAKITGIQGFEKLIAIKTILPHLTVEKELLDSFIDEAKLAALLHHQNVVQIYDFGAMEGSYFIAMEFLFGKDLRHIFAKSLERRLPMSLELSLYIISRVCSGLDYAHTLQDFQGKPLSIIHRDISPQNIFVTYEGDVKIVDFGIAKAASQSTITQFGMIKGKIAYMSPEQASGHPIDHRSDIFSTGIILYEMVTGKRMFTGADTLQILAKVSRAEFESPEVVCNSLSPKICTILRKALTKDPDQRYQSCGEMLTDIEECLFELSLRPSARGLSQYTKELFHDEIATEGQIMRDMRPAEAQRSILPEKETKAATSVQEPVAEAPAGETSKPRKGKPLLFAAAGAVIVVVILVAAFAFKGKSVTAPVREAAVKPAQTAEGGPGGRTAPENVAPKVAPPDAKKPEKGPAPGEEAKALQDKAAGVIEKDPKEAKTLLLQAVQLDPASVQGHFQLGLAYMRLKDYGKAIEAYQKAATLDPKLPDTFFNLGYLYAVGKDYAKAEEMYGRTVTLAPSYVDEALFNLGMVQEKQGKRKESIENLEKALSINPKNEMARKLLDKLKQKS